MSIESVDVAFGYTDLVLEDEILVDTVATI